MCKHKCFEMAEDLAKATIKQIYKDAMDEADDDRNGDERPQPAALDCENAKTLGEMVDVLKDVHHLRGACSCALPKTAVVC